MPIVYLSCAWIAGIFLGGRLNLPPALGLIGLLPLSLLFLRKQRKPIILSALAIIAFFTAAAYSWSSLHSVEPDSLQNYNGRGVVSIRGMIASDPDTGDKGTSLELAASEIKLDAGWQTIKGTTRVFVPRYPAYHYGDILLVTGKLEIPSQLADFDYKGYLEQRGIYSTMLFPKIELLDTGRGFKPPAWVYLLRSRLAGTLAQALPEPQASLAQGILLGIRGNIPASVKADFYQTGTTHILAISGMNLGILTGILLGLWMWLLGRRHYIYVWLTLGVIWSYTLLTGMQPPVVRAAIMASVFLAAELLGRQRSAMVALTLAAAIMVGVNPGVLREASFQLSFMAMAGLVWLYPPLQALGRRIVQSRLGESSLMSIICLVSDALAVTLAATIAVWPLVAYYFGIISLVGPLATLLVIPALPAIIITAALTGVFGLLFMPAAQILGFVAWPFLSYMLVTVNVLAKSPLGFVEVGALSTGVIWAYYVLLAIAIALKNYWPKMAGEFKARVNATLGAVSGTPAKWIIPPLLVLAVLTTTAAASMPDDRLHVSFLDVGEGDAILIQKANQKILVDGGPSPQAIDLRLGEKMPFWDR
ncbi:MAG: ComEC/Rec2 family competence protein, partial [Dehalococcoidales bacterium]|nr:ComEC/Rec2 family competence protein [Dehalococcoidales bacterium]